MLVCILKFNGAIIIDPKEYLTNFLGFTFYWMLISIFIHKIPALKEHINTVKKIALLLMLLVVILVVDSIASMPDNPITILFFLVFYLSMAYFLAPSFFNKYRTPILVYYGLVFSIFLYLRLFSESFEIYRQNGKEIFLLFIMPIPVFFGLWSYQQWKWFQNLKSEKAQAELAMLQAQINPHFFFNTLNNLYALAIKKSDRAPEVILKLSDMMRYTIYEGKKDLVSIEEEVQYLNNFIELHKIRYKKKVVISFEHDVKSGTKIAPLLFMILLENAFKHGVESLSENAFIKVNLSEKENYVYFELENNFDPNRIGKTSGIGIDNLKRRLKIIYQNDYELSVNKTPQNYKVTLKIPVNA